MGFLPQLLTAVALQTVAQLGLGLGDVSALWGLLLRQHRHVLDREGRLGRFQDTISFLF